MSVELSILHTNDVHSRFAEWTRLVTLLKRTRAEAERGGRAVLYLDAGDHGDRSIPATDATQARANIKLLAAAGCDAMTAGNNETLVWPWAVQTDRAREAPFPVLAANVRFLDGSPVPGYQERTVLQPGPLRVGVFGFAPVFDDYYRFAGSYCLPTDQTVMACVESLRAAGCDLVIFLSHLGIHEDRRLAAADLGIDVIVGGHTHNALETGEQHGRTLVVQAGEYGRFLGRLDLTVEPTAPVGERIVRWQAQLLPTEQEVPDEATARLVAQQEEEAAAILAEPLFTLPEGLPHDAIGESPLAEVLAAYQLRHHGADLALVQGGVLLGGVPAGPVTLGDLLRICPTVLNPSWSMVPGRVLLQWLEQSADPAVAEMPARRAGMRGVTPLGRLFAAGLTWEVDPVQPVGQRVRGVLVDGAPLELERAYKVACNDFLIYGWYGYTAGKEAGLALAGCDSDDFMRDALRAALQAHVAAQRDML